MTPEIRDLFIDFHLFAVAMLLAMLILIGWLHFLVWVLRILLVVREDAHRRVFKGAPKDGVQGTLAVRADQQFNQALNEGDGGYKP